MAGAERLSGWLRRNWFLPLLAVLLAIEFAFARTTIWATDPVAEAVILFDLCLFVPGLYVLCYRRTVALKPLLLRTAALAGSGLYIASWLMPADAQRLIAELSWARTAGLVMLVLVELWVMAKLVRLVFGGEASAEQLAGRHGVPQWVARLMLLEARFWKAVWRFLRRP